MFVVGTMGTANRQEFVGVASSCHTRNESRRSDETSVDHTNGT